jgi:hypothetical protein
MLGHDQPRPAANRGQHTHADQPEYLGFTHTENPRGFLDGVARGPTGGNSGFHRCLSLLDGRSPPFGEPSPLSKATIERDNYANLRIKDFLREYPQFGAASVCLDIHNRNANERNISVENVDLSGTFEVIEQATEVHPRRAVGAKLVS